MSHYAGEYYRGRCPFSEDEVIQAGYSSVRDFAWAQRDKMLASMSQEGRRKFLDQEALELQALVGHLDGP